LQTDRKINFFAKILLFFVSLNLVSGASVAGIQAGKVFNTWPLMNGSFLPSDYWKCNLKYRNFFENRANVQFNHRIFAYNTLFFVVLGFLRFRSFHTLTKYVPYESSVNK
jgi:cytochrome c oxidase assembly protein subunit 15